MTKLVQITLKRRADGLWDVVRERAKNGEGAAGLKDLGECFDYVMAHDGEPTIEERERVAWDAARELEAPELSRSQTRERWTTFDNWAQTGERGKCSQKDGEER